MSEPYQTSWYVGWRANRLKVWTAKYGLEWFQNKTILEVGAGYGDIGNFFAQLGAHVTCTDAHKGQVDKCRERYPQVQAKILDAEKEFMEEYDLVISTGLLYHVSPEGVPNHIRSLCRSRNAILETLVVDTDDPEYIVSYSESDASRPNPKQAYSGCGSRFSASYIEALLDKEPVSWIRDDNPKLNSPFPIRNKRTTKHSYDWEVKNTYEWAFPQLRRCWYVRHK